MSIIHRALGRRCRQHGNNNAMFDGCYYCWQKYHHDIASCLKPEDRLLRQIFGEGRYYKINTRRLRSAEKSA